MQIETKAEAQKALADLAIARKEQGEQLAKNAEAIDDLRKAVKVLGERQAEPVQFDGDEAKLAQFVTGKAHAPVRMLGERDPVSGVRRDGLLDSERVHGDWHADLRELVGKRNLVRAMQRNPHTPTLDAQIGDHMKVAPAPIRRAFDTGTGTGAEWMPTAYIPQLEEELRQMRRTPGLFEVVQMPEATVVSPFLSTGLRPYIKGAPTGDDPAQYTASSLVTDNRTRTATGFAVRLVVSEDAAEDSLIAFEPVARRELIAAITDGLNDSIINGDATASHQDAIASWDIRSRWGDTGLGGAADHRRAYTGLRARAYDVSNTTDHATLTYAKVLLARASLASPHGVDGDLVLICSPEAYLTDILALAEVATVDKYGPAATVLTGEVARLGGLPIVVDEFVSSDLATTGLYTGSGSTTGFLVLNRSRFKIGMRRGAAVEVDKDITRGIFQMVATVRHTFWTEDATAKKNVHWSFNL